jgi:hypothetical protein
LAGWSGCTWSKPAKLKLTDCGTRAKAAGTLSTPPVLQSAATVGTLVTELRRSFLTWRYVRDGSADQIWAAAAATMGAANEVPLAHTMTWPVEPVQSMVVISAMFTPGAIRSTLRP